MTPVAIGMMIFFPGSGRRRLYRFDYPPAEDLEEADGGGRLMDMLIFKEAEFLGRIALCQKRQREQGFNGMLVSAEANINYYSGYRTHAPWTTFTRPMFLFIPAEGRPLLYTQTFVTPEARLRSYGCRSPKL